MSASPEPNSPQDADTRRKPESEKRLGKYRILRQIGRGGMGVVFEAEDTLLMRRVAIKVLSSAIAKHPDSLERFLREARATAKLLHPHVVAIHEVDQKNGLWFIAMELISGGSVHDYLAVHGALPWQEATRMIAEACLGLNAAHREGLVHRDIKPANLMRTRDGQIKLVDFGLAKANEDTSTLTTSGTVIGTPNYMSPEQWRAEPLNDLCDIYALGATYYTLLTGQAPHAKLDSMQVMYACCIGSPPNPASIVASIPDACVAIVRKSMAREPMDRYASALDMLYALQSLLTPGTQDTRVPIVNTTNRYQHSSSTSIASKSLSSIEQLIQRLPKSVRPPSLRELNRRWIVILSATALILLSLSYLAWQTNSRKTSGKNFASSIDASSDWTPLFNGENLDNWQPLKSPPGSWKIENGLLVGRVDNSTSDASSYLITKRNDFENFELIAEVNISEMANSGIFMRCDEDSSLPRGLEAHLATTYCGELHRTWVHDEKPVSARESPIALSPDTWVIVRATVQDNHIVVQVNDQVTADVYEHANSPKRGRIGIQVYGTQTVVQIRRLEVRSLP